MKKNSQVSIRVEILRLSVIANEGHIPSSFSIVEILLAIEQYLKSLRFEDLLYKKLILSKAHAVFALYGFMSVRRHLPKRDLDKICAEGSYLIGHVPVKPEHNFFIGAGSLGQGFPIAVGKAYGSSLISDSIPQFVIIGDGELNEGSCWEALLFMQKFTKINLRVFIDNNLSSTRALPMDKVFKALGAGWKCVEVDGHNIDEMVQVLNDHSSMENLVIICNTQKGYPIKKMGGAEWHHRIPSEHESQEFAQDISTFFDSRP